MRVGEEMEELNSQEEIDRITNEFLLYKQKHETEVIIWQMEVKALKNEIKQLKGCPSTL